MKAKSSNAHTVNSKHLITGTFRDTSNQFMKVKSFNAHIVNTKQLGKEASRDTSSQFIS